MIQITTNFPKYKKLNIYIEYNIDIIYKIHTNIIELLGEMLNHTDTKNKDIKKNQKQSGLGINLNNLINKKKYDNLIIKSNIEMFIYHLNNFNSDINTYLSKLIKNIKTMNNNLNKELNFDDNLVATKNRMLPADKKSDS